MSIPYFCLPAYMFHAYVNNPPFFHKFSGEVMHYTCSIAAISLRSPCEIVLGMSSRVPSTGLLARLNIATFSTTILGLFSCRPDGVEVKLALAFQSRVWFGFRLSLAIMAPCFFCGVLVSEGVRCGNGVGVFTHDTRIY